jgi:hypothetical protein
VQSAVQWFHRDAHLEGAEAFSRSSARRCSSSIISVRINHAIGVHRLGFTESTAESHMAASELMISVVSELLDVWDGKPARGYGGTADVVARARECGRRVRVIWPERATRD